MSDVLSHLDSTATEASSSYASHMQVGKSTIHNLQGQNKIKRCGEIKCNDTKSMAKST